MDRQQQLIRTIRERFESELSQNESLYHPIDIERVRKYEWQIKRYLEDCDNDVEQAYKNMIKTLQWKQSFGVHTLKQSQFPREMYETYRIETETVDRTGRLTITESFIDQRYYAELIPFVQKLTVFSMETLDHRCGENGIIYIGDFTNTPLANLNVSLARFRVEVLNQYYPGLAKKILLINIPFLLKPVIKLIVSFMKASIRNAVEHGDFETLKKYIEPELLHTDQGGMRNKRILPQDCSTMQQLVGSDGLTKEFVDKWCKDNGY
ncbi:hypothetical protein RDWZM_006480 [Blomia tropicalis]|uniref:CRAL-TRIO domain-containing protein n=1 Tax=Blomia tropicalis TaxID=40697 RepID=A0A9Q0M695_BLOTA|nr:hypothetical protein RDWZM_006480 [Blomia tropicalis]